MGAIVRAALRGAQAQVRHVRPVPPRAARALVAATYVQVERDFGMLAPPVSLHSPAPGSLAASWSMLRETLLATGRLDRATKEAVAAAVSVGNTCPYCVDVHSATLHGLTGGPSAALVAADRIDAVADPRLRAIATWARASGQRDAAAAHPPPVLTSQLPELIGVAVTFHYLNRMVNVFLAESPLPPSVPARARETVLRLFGRVLAPSARRSVHAGESVDLLPSASLPDDLSWAADSRHVAGAFARAAAALDLAGVQSVPASVRETVDHELAEWTGAPLEFGGAWLAEAVAGLPAADRATGRLALLTAAASYRVSDTVIEAYRVGGHDDAVLVDLTSWASMAAARRIGAWLWEQLAPATDRGVAA